MDDATLAGLRKAWELSPDNGAVLALLLRSYLERGEAAEGIALADGRETVLDAQGRLLLARSLLEADRHADGLQQYREAIAQNAALEDATLLARLEGRVRTVAPRDGRGPRLTVISNDDTSVQEVDRVVQPPLERVTFADIGGLDDVKEQIRRKIILPFQKPGLFQRFRKRAGGGILLYGPPGCGKTLMARATAGECNANFHNVAISDVLDMYIGESERKLKAIFDRARESVPCVLFFDEIEALGGRRQHAREATSAKVVSQFLSEMDGFAQGNAGVLVLAATNVPWAVDSAFRRPGRFDRVQFVPPPDRAARHAILDLLLAGRPLGPIDVKHIAANTPGFSGADLRHLVETAVEEAIEASIAAEREVPLEDKHLKAALKQVKPTTGEWLTTARNYARYANEGGQYDDVLAFIDRNARA
jgi:transitional endoplasmic reticulum ATPase